MPEYEVTLVEDIPEGQPLSFGDGRTISDEIVFDNTPKLVQLTLTGEQYMKICSALSNGAWWTYPDEWLEVLASFWQNLAEATLSCEEIIDCIENDPDVMLAVTASLQGAGLVDPNTVDPDGTTVPQRFAGNEQDLEDQIGTLEDCNLDALWGAIRHGIVLYLDDNARNFLEDLTAQADLGERAAALLEMIPVVGDIAAGLTKQFVEVAPDLLNLFNAYSSEQVLDEIACDIFELVCAECRFPTWEELYQIYSSAGISGIEDIQTLVLTAATDLLIGSSGLAALACYYTIITYELFILYLSAKFKGARGTGSIALWADIGEDFESDNWIALCDGCEPDIFEPVISIAPCNNVAGQTCGTIVSYQGSNVWRISSTHRAEGNDEGVTLADAQGRLFRVTSTAKVSGTDIFAFTRANDACEITNGFGTGAGTDIKNIIWVTPNTQVWVYDITVVLA